MSHSLKVVRIAAVCCAMTSCCRDLAAQRRHLLARETAIRRLSRRLSSVAISASGERWSTLSRFCAAASASAFVRRPPLPLPRDRCGSSFSSSTIRRTAGESTSAFGDFFSPRRRRFLAIRVRLVLRVGRHRHAGSRRGRRFLDRRHDFADLHFLRLRPRASRARPLSRP